MFIGWLDCRQDYMKNIQHISTKLGWRMGLGPEKTPITIGAAPDKVNQLAILRELVWVRETH